MLDRAKLDELIAKVPDPELQGWLIAWLPAFARMTADELAEWIEKLVLGNHEDAYLDLLQRMTAEEQVIYRNRVLKDWHNANADNAARLAQQRSAVFALLKIGFGIALAGAGL